MLHEIKIEFPYYVAVKEGRKTFEIRNNDRGYNAGDEVLMIPVQDSVRCVLHPFLHARIGYVTGYAQKDGYVVFSLLDVKEQL